MTETSTFEPQIIALCCMHDRKRMEFSGSSRLAYPPYLKIVAIPCTGRTDIVQVMKTFEEGADGVMVAG